MGLDVKFISNIDLLSLNLNLKVQAKLVFNFLKAGYSDFEKSRKDPSM